MKSEKNKELLDEKKELLEEEKSSEATLEDDKKVEDANVVEEDKVIEETPIEKVSSEVVYEYKNTSYWTKEGYYEMNNTKSKESILLVVICELLLAAFSGFFFYSYFVEGKVKNLVFAIIILAVVVAYPFTLRLLYKHQLNKTYKLYDKQFNNAKYEFKFNKDFILIHFTAGDLNKEMSYSYKSIYRLIETNDYMFFFISSNESFTVEKKGFDNPTDADAVKEFVINNGVKYKDQRKKVK